MSRPVCGVCMCLEDETGCGCGQNNDQISTTLHDNNSNVNVQVDKNPTFKGGSDIPVAWIVNEGDKQWLTEEIEPHEKEYSIPLYTSPQYNNKFIGDLRNLVDAQGQKGTWDASPYMTGLFNGLEMALSIFEQREPQFKDIASPQYRELSDDEIEEIYYKDFNFESADMIEFAKVILKKAKENENS